MIAMAVFVLCLWLRLEPGFSEWIEILRIEIVYIGPYILIAVSVVVIVASFLGCLSALQENNFLMYIFIGTQVVGFLGYVAGSAVLLDNTTKNSNMQPIVRESMRSLIMNSRYDKGQEILAMIQENIGCCGADGPGDYIDLRKPLPRECRDTVTGNAFFHGCVSELTWFFEEKTAWIAALAMTAAMFHVFHIVMTFVLTRALAKEADETTGYRR
ncbi:tetraspanin-2A isoform X2 [Onthophagus taurus]|nr:tetraspanin-2A isoform X2 [Onthophagus taurus]XP_022904593.1 tetraspanin-2A isoform X2 [Onthophagus taurus]XP_022904595.1 tetraspanin-2A isoform X2 [Onthophagus taurus]XP_022904596.1 tetraspanin-2A isoform X2 [Onthophagus taurus]